MTLLTITPLRVFIKLLVLESYGVYIFTRLDWRAQRPAEERHWVN